MVLHVDTLRLQRTKKKKKVGLMEIAHLAHVVKFLPMSSCTEWAGQASWAAAQSTRLLEDPKYHWNK